jgi:hypothetical protein
VSPALSFKKIIIEENVILQILTPKITSTLGLLTGILKKKYK